MKFEALDKELQDLLYSPDTSKLISVLKEGKKPLFLEQISQLDLESCKHLGFPVLWSLYEDDFIPFEEDFLIEKFADTLDLLNKHKEIESFILKRPRIAKEIGEKLPSYFLEKRDISVTEYEKLLDFGAKGFFISYLLDELYHKVDYRGFIATEQGKKSVLRGEEFLRCGFAALNDTAIGIGCIGLHRTE